MTTFTRVLIPAWVLAIAAGCGGPRIALPAPYEDLLAAVATDSTDPQAHYYAALAHWSKEHWPDVERELAQALAIDPHYAEAYLALAFLPRARIEDLIDEQERSGDPTIVPNAFAEAELKYRRAMLIDPLVDQSIVSALNLQPVRTLAIRVGEQSFLIWSVTPYAHAVDRFYQGDYQDAFEALTTIMEREPARWRLADGVFWYRGLAAAQLSRFGEALADIQVLFEREMQRESQEAESSSFLAVNEYRYLLGCLELRAGRLGIAARFLEEAVRLDPSLYMAHVRLADTHEYYRRWLDAVQARRRALEMAPDNPSLLRDLALTLYRAGEPEEAAAILEDLTARSTVHPLVWYDLGVVLEDLGRADAARDALQQFLRVVPSRFADHRADAQRRLTALPR